GEAAEQRRAQAEALGEKAADEVRDDAEDLVEQEERCHGERAVAPLVEVEENQDADGPVGDRVRPVRPGHDGVVAQVACPSGPRHAYRSAWRPTTEVTMRPLCARHRAASPDGPAPRRAPSSTRSSCLDGDPPGPPAAGSAGGS